jgi:hypothetical protein
MGVLDWLRRLGVPADPDHEDPEDDGDEELSGVTTVGDVVGGCPEGFRREANDLVGFRAEYDLDYGTASLARLDDLAASRDDRATYVSVETADGETVEFAPAATGAACYFGEVLVRTHGGEWTRRNGRWTVAVDGPGGLVHVDVFAVAHDCLEGESTFVAAAESATREAGVVE